MAATVVTEASSSSGPVKGKRGTNFLNWEDGLLAKAFVSVSMDPSKGCGQTLLVFWTRVTDKFMLLYEYHKQNKGSSDWDKVEG